MTKPLQRSCLLVSAALVGCSSDVDLGDVQQGQDNLPSSPIVQFAPSPLGMCGLHATGEVGCFHAGKPATAGVIAKFDRPMRLAGAGSQGPMCTVGWYGQLSCSGYSTDGRVGSLKTMRWDKNFVDVKLGFFGGCVLIEEGSVACWGTVSPSVELRGGSIDFGPASAEVVRLPRPAVQIAVGENHACAVLDDGTVYCHGNNAYGQVNTELGDGHDYDFTPPVAVPGIIDAKQVAVTAHATCVLHASGKVTCFGAADQTGLGPVSAPSAHGQPTELEGVTDIGSGRLSVCARRAGITGGDLYCWGSNDCGVLDGNPLACDGYELQLLERPTLVGGMHKVQTFGLSDNMLCANDGIFSWCLGGRYDYQAAGAVGHWGPYVVPF